MPENNDSGSIDRVVTLMFENARAQISTFYSGTRLAWAEVRLLASRAGLLIALLIIFTGMTLVTWSLLLTTGAFVLRSYGFSMVQACLAVLLLQICGMAGILLLILHTVKSITLKHTRSALGLTLPSSEPANDGKA